MTERPSITEAAILHYDLGPQEMGRAATSIVFQLAVQGRLMLDPRTIHGIHITQIDSQLEAPLTAEQQDVLDTLFPTPAASVRIGKPGGTPIGRIIFEKARSRLLEQGLIKPRRPDRIARRTRQLLIAGATGIGVVAAATSHATLDNRLFELLMIAGVGGGSLGAMPLLVHAFRKNHYAALTQKGGIEASALKRRLRKVTGGSPGERLPYLILGNDTLERDKLIGSMPKAPDWWNGPWNNSKTEEKAQQAPYRIYDAARHMTAAFDPAPKHKTLPRHILDFLISGGDDIPDVSDSDN